jgi:hypothetical protein
MRRLGFGNVSENDTISYENVSRTICATIRRDLNDLVKKGCDAAVWERAWGVL